MRKTVWGLLLAIATISCSKVEEKPLFIPKEKVDVESVAVLISKMGVDAPICDEIFTGVTENAEKGWDETFYFNDQWNRHTKGAEMSSLFLQKLQDAISCQTKAEGSDLSMDRLLSQNVRIYWPYSDNWDGVTEPVITFCLDEYEKYGPDDQVDVVAYRLAGPDGNPEKVMVNEDYARKNPVWVVGTNGVDHTISTKGIGRNDFEKQTILIDFDDDHGHGGSNGGNNGGNTGGNNSGNNSGNTGGNNGGNNAGAGSGSGNTTVYVWKLSSFKFTRQYDCWLLGGPDFHFEVSYPTGAGYASGNMKYEFELKRDQIDKWITVNVPLNTNWTTQQITNYLYICEEDRNPNIDFECELGWDLSIGDVVKTKGKISYHQTDEEIFSGPYDRDYVRSPEMNNKAVGYDFKENNFGLYVKMIWQEITF